MPQRAEPSPSMSHQALCQPVLAALRRWKQEDWEVRVTLSYIVPGQPGLHETLSQKKVCLFFQGEEKEESTQGWEASLDGRKATQLWLLTARLCGYRSAFKCARWSHEIKGLSFIYSWFRFLFFFFPPFFLASRIGYWPGGP